MTFRIELSRHAREHLKGLRKRDQQIVVDAVAVKLGHQPDLPTRQIKKLEDNELAPWELRVGEFRVFYDVDPKNKIVSIIAVGRKAHNVLRIGGKEFKL